jgi:hypothetical protein
MQIFGLSLTLTWPLRLCLLSSPVHEPLLQAFSFPSTLGEVTLHLLSQACMFIYSSHGKWVFPSSCGVFLPLLLLQAFQLLIAGQCCCSCRLVCLFTVHVGGGSSPLSCGVFLLLPLSQAFLLLVAGCTPPLLPEPLWPGPACLFTVPGGIPLPTLWSSGHPTLFTTCLYCSYCLLLSSLFSLGGGRSVQGAMLIWPRVVCGSTTYHLSHLVHVFPSYLSMGIWRPGGPPGFSV